MKDFGGSLFFGNSKTVLLRLVRKRRHPSNLLPGQAAVRNVANDW